MKTDSGLIRFTELFTGLCELHNKIYSETLTDIYHGALSGYSIEQVSKAMGLSIKSCQFFPKPVDIINLIPESLKISSNSKAQIEADKIISHLNTHGHVSVPVLDDPITKHLMTKHWPYVKWAKTVLDSQITWWTKDFIEAYKAYDETDKQQFLEAPKNVLKLLDGIGTETET